MKTTMKMRLLCFLLCFILLVGLMPTPVFAIESTTVTTYDALWKAIFSKDDYYITLGCDITYSVPEGGNAPLQPYQYLLNVDGTKNKTLDLNGHTLQVSNERTNWPTTSGLFNIDDTASLTVMNGTIKLYNYNNSQRDNIGVFNARDGYLTLTNVDVVNSRNGTAVNAQNEATVTIEGGSITAYNGFAVTAVGSSWLILDKGVILTTSNGSGLITQPADYGYGSLHASTPNLFVVSAMFEAGLEIAESTIGQFSPAANRLVFVNNQKYNSAFAKSKSGDYYWDTNATGGCALVANDSGYSFAKKVQVISTTTIQAVSVTNGSASPKQATYGSTVTITANDIPGKVFIGWTVENGDVTLADPNAKTTTFTMGARLAEIKAHYKNAPITSSEFMVETPVQGGHPSAATTTAEHITVSETWCVELYDEYSFSSTLPDNHIFEGGHTYRIGVVFEVEHGYSLDDNFSAKFVDPISRVKTPASQGSSRYVWIVDYLVEDHSVEITSVAATISGAHAGATAGSTTAATNDSTYTVAIKGWYDCDSVFSHGSANLLQDNEKFVSGKTYTVGVTFTPLGFNSLATNLAASINGAEGFIGSWDLKSRIFYITITIPQPQPYTITVTGGTASCATAVSGTTVTLKANAAPQGKVFDKWVVTGATVANATAPTTTFIMPAANVAATATYKNCAHSYSNPCDPDCNLCAARREPPHQYGSYLYNNDATSEKDGTKTRTCALCQNPQTITAGGTKLIDSSKKFKDVPQKAWYKQYVDYAVTNGIFTGTSATTFSPNTNMTRAQFVQVFANLSGVDTSNKKVHSGFTDVPQGKWFTPAVAWAAKNGIVAGMGNGKFAPNAKVTREQMCVMIVNYIENYQKKSLNKVVDAPDFADHKKIASWARAAVYKCADAKLINGVGKNKFAPKDPATRAQGTTIFTFFFKEYMK